MADIVAGKKVGLKENFLSLRTALGFAVAVVIIYIFLRFLAFDQVEGFLPLGKPGSHAALTRYGVEDCRIGRFNAGA